MKIIKEFEQKCKEDFWYYPKYIGLRIMLLVAMYMLLIVEPMGID